MKRCPIDALREKAAELGAEAKRTGKINGQAVPKEELGALDEAARPGSWERHGSLDIRSDGRMVECLDCDPLDDTLRCYIAVSKEGTILDARLEIE